MISEPIPAPPSTLLSLRSPLLPSRVLDEAPAHERLGNDRLRAAVQRALEESGYASLGSLELQAIGGTVVLWGVVRSFYLKQLAQEVAKRVANVGRVVNYVQVDAHQHRAKAVRATLPAHYAAR